MSDALKELRDIALDRLESENRSLTGVNFSAGDVWKDEHNGCWIANIEEVGTGNNHVAAQAVSRDIDEVERRRDVMLAALISLAPTAPVEASGSEREGWKKRLAGIQIGRSVDDTYSAFPFPEASFRGDIGHALSALRPQPSGETRLWIKRDHLRRISDPQDPMDGCMVWSEQLHADFVQLTSLHPAQDAIDDVISHYSDWREALIAADAAEETPEDGSGKPGYWLHQVKVLDRVLAALIRPAPVASGGQHSSGEGSVADIVAERRRQIEAEGWSVENDDEHDDSSLAHAAAAYVLGAGVGTKVVSYRDDVSGGRGETPVWGTRERQVPLAWPASWDARWWKPSNRRRDLVKAGALIVAEIERLDRAEDAK